MKILDLGLHDRSLRTTRAANMANRAVPNVENGSHAKTFPLLGVALAVAVMFHGVVKILPLSGSEQRIGTHGKSGEAPSNPVTAFRGGDGRRAGLLE
jgi:hypothetical protein